MGSLGWSRYARALMGSLGWSRYARALMGSLGWYGVVYNLKRNSRYARALFCRKLKEFKKELGIFINFMGSKLSAEGSHLDSPASELSE
jgi:hypothetical protein